MTDQIITPEREAELLALPEWPPGFYPLSGDARLGKCASRGCGQHPSWRVELVSIGSFHCCEPCARKIAGVPHEMQAALRAAVTERDRLRAEVAAKDALLRQMAEALERMLEPFSAGPGWLDEPVDQIGVDMGETALAAYREQADG